MEKTHQITFARVARDCPANEGARPREVIYDFDVLIDGVKRATFHRGYGKGYELEDLNDDNIFPQPLPPNVNPHYHRVKAEKQADFAAIIEGLLLSNRIPTVEDTKQAYEGWGRALLETRDVASDKALAHAIQERARVFYDLAIAVSLGVGCLHEARKLLSEVNLRHAQMDKTQDEYYPPTKWEAAAIAAFKATQVKA